MTHGDLVNLLLIDLDAYGFFWSNATGKARSMDGRRVISYGFVGSSDIIGMIRPTGRFIGIECKVGKDRQRTEQKTFQRVSTANGGVYLIAHSTDGTGDDARNYIKDQLNDL